MASETSEFSTRRLREPNMAVSSTAGFLGIVGPHEPAQTGISRFRSSFCICRHIVSAVLDAHMLNSVCVCVCTLYTRMHLQHRSPREPDLDSTFQERAFSRHDSESSRPLRDPLLPRWRFYRWRSAADREHEFQSRSPSQRFLYLSRVALAVSKTRVVVEFFEHL